ncbi:ATP-binding protein [Thermoflexibacter ruber]|uniref:PD-(D/E)XK nuclease superfamily protein n=1 Tax=Thermoflexibacter ruber TaxID=1003 RepID=A0A1I2FLZ6_9BACT|nr:ATP-binding protein [Thermoflexibacter ruber]SFF05798.1 PD-(D/E)XK nuclease superfamily protein [Thermoflexibacter ruber]
MKKLPLGVQDFKKIIEGNYLYVDKTAFIYQLINSASYLFMSRPRRFGKSLLISILQELFRGHKALFAGLWIEDKLAWEAYPTIVIDFNTMSYKEKPLIDELSKQLLLQAKEYEITLKEDNYKHQFTELIRSLSKKYKKRVVVLVDEYDKALTDMLELPDRLDENRRTLKNFYSTIKSEDPYLHFVLLTGVSKFGKISIFSDLNNLLDLTLDQSLTCLFGYTQQELEHYFMPHLEQASKRLATPLPDLLETIKYWYNGYSWDGKNTLYNPFSILSFFYHARFSNYWFDTGTPTFLTKLLKERKTPSYQLDNLLSDEMGVSYADPERIDAISLLFQTGYLTIKEADWRAAPPALTLSYPNFEVKESFLKYLLAEYTNFRPNEISTDILARIKKAILGQDWEDFFDVLHAVFASVPYQIFKTEEAYFHSLTHVVLKLTDMVVFSEVVTNRGRMDMVLSTPTHIYIFEFKTKGTAGEALAQIIQQGYAERFATEGKEIALVGVVFDSENKGVKEWEIKMGK